MVELANKVARNTRLGTVTLESQCPPGPQPRVLPCASEYDEAAAVARWLVEQHEAGVPWREQAVLYRVHAQSPLFEAALAQAEVPFTVRGGEGLLRPSRGTPGDGHAHRGGPARPGRSCCRRLPRRAGPARLDEQPPRGQGRVRERWESLAAVLALAEDVVAAQPGRRPGRASSPSWPRGTQAEHPLSADGVTLSTLHAAKGLEWTAVALVGAQEGTLPLSLAAGPEQVAEEARLFYVGITRSQAHAADHLVAVAPRRWRQPPAVPVPRRDRRPAGPRAGPAGSRGRSRRRR